MLNKFLRTILVYTLLPMSLMASSDPTDGEPAPGSRPMRVVSPSLTEQADFFDGRKTLEELNKSRAELGAPPLNGEDLERVRDGFYQLRDLGRWFANGFLRFMKGVAKQ